jgi:flagellar M-ring protein FliF
MPESLQRVTTQMATLWGGLTRVQRLAILATVGASLLGLLLVGVWGQRPDLATLYVNLSPADAGQVVEQLKAQRVPYRIEDQGTRILVPSGVMHETRMKLATQGLPQGGGVGFELFDRTSFGATDFVQKLNYQRALQGELARTIGQIREVHQARVHVVLPQPSVFSDKERQTTASVVLTLRPGSRLSPEQVRAIVHLVSGSVEGLAAEQVTVIDSGGRLLSQRQERGVGGVTGGSQMEQQASVELELQRRVQGMLDEVLGPGKASVRVAAQVEFTHGERTEERVDPNTVVKSESRSSETTRGSSARPGGAAVAAGAAGNVGTPAAGAAGNSSSNETLKEQESIQYEVGRIVERRSLVAGEIKRLSVAVLVDPPYKTTPGAAGQEQKIPLPRDKAELEKLRAMVMRAVGFNPARGDEVEVAEIAFDTSVAERERQAAEQAERQAFWWSAGKQAGLGAAGLVLLLVVVRPLLASLRRRAAVGTRLDLTEAAVAAVGAVGAAGIGSPLAARAAAALNPGQMMKVREREELADKLEHMARTDPQQVAQLIRSWMLGKRS